VTAIPFLFLIYFVLLSIALLLAWISTGTKRRIIKKRFLLDETHMKALDTDPMLKKFVILDWSMAFVFAGFLLVPAVVFGENVWLVTTILELAFIVLGLLVVRLVNITDWYMECFIVDFRYYWSSLILTFAAILTGNVVYAINMRPYGIIAELVAMSLMSLSLLLLISPLLSEWRFYTESGLNDWIEFIKKRHEIQEEPQHSLGQ